jgi:hypothetical protein
VREPQFDAPPDYGDSHEVVLPSHRACCSGSTITTRADLTKWANAAETNSHTAGGASSMAAGPCPEGAAVDDESTSLPSTTFQSRSVGRNAARQSLDSELHPPPAAAPKLTCA